MANGKKTREYKSVLEHKTSICECLRVNTDGKTSLTGKYQEKEWLSIGAKPDEETLVDIVLNRISNDARQYDIFMEMLVGIPGIDIILKNIKGIEANVYSTGRTRSHLTRKECNYDVDTTLTLSVPCLVVA